MAGKRNRPRRTLRGGVSAENRGNFDGKQGRTEIQKTMTIYNYPIQIVGFQKVELPINAAILTVQMQGETLCLWARVEERNTTTEQRKIEIVATGQPMSQAQRWYIGTVQTADGLVWHVFDNA